MDVNATAERMGRRQGQGQSFLLRATNLGTLGYGGGPLEGGGVKRPMERFVVTKKTQNEKYAALLRNLKS